MFKKFKSSKQPSTSGNNAEQLAAEQAHSQGFTIVARNYHCRYGEIDLIASRQQTLAIIEVRYRKHQHWGGALCSVGRSKQQRIIATTQQFLLCNPHYAHYNIRFDVIVFEQQLNRKHCTWIEHAFTA